MMYPKMPPPSIRAFFGLFFCCLVVSFSAISCKKIKKDERRENGVLVEQTETNLRTNEVILKRQFFPSGKVFMETNFENGKIVGQKIFHENGQIQETRPYDKQGFLNGKYQKFYPDGTLEKEGRYENNELTGEFRSYHPNGKVRETLSMEHDLEQGAFTEFHANGQRAADGTYKSGVEHGVLHKYDSTGTLIQTMDCVEGRCQTIKN